MRTFAPSEIAAPDLAPRDWVPITPDSLRGEQPDQQHSDTNEGLFEICLGVMPEVPHQLD